MSSAVVPTTSTVTLPETPYKGLMPYSEDDALFFFGRDVWREIITDNMRAYRLTLLYGESGVGKTSVLQAGVAYHLRERARRNLAEDGIPELAVAVFSSWRDDPLAGLTRCLHEAVADTLGEEPSEPERSLDLEATLEGCAQRVGGKLFVILDQFEEYFLYHPSDVGEETVDEAFARAVNNRDLRVSFLISIREDGLAKLDRFKGRIGNLFDNYLRIEHLDREAAREAIERPLERFNALRPEEDVELETELVEAVLNEVEAGKLQVGQAGDGVVATAAGEQAGIETPYLQLVLTRLWYEEMSAGSNVLRLETLTRLGGAEGIVETHLDAAMGALSPAERDAAARVFRYLVTRSRTKIAHRVSDLTDWTELSEAELAPVLDKLSRGDARILRPVGESSFEIYHDVLAEAVLAWRTNHEAQRRLEQEKREAEARTRRKLIKVGVVAGLLALVGSVLFALLAVSQRNEASRQRDEASLQKDIARSREVAASAISQLPDVEPELGVLLAISAWNINQTDEAADALRQALLASHALAVLRGHTAFVGSAAFSPDGRLVVTASDDRTARVWVAASGKSVAVLRGHQGAVLSAGFSLDGRRVLTAGKDGTARVWEAASGKSVAVLRPRERFKVPSGSFVPYVSVDLSPDGKLVLMASADGAARLWEVSTGREIGVLRGERGALINSAAFSPDGRLVVTASDDGTARMWEAASGKSVAVLRGHLKYYEVAHASFSPDGRLVVTASRDGTARVWEAASGKSVSVLRGHRGSVYSAVFSPDGRLVVTASDDRTARVWKAASGKSVAVLRGLGILVRRAVFSPDSRLVVTAGGDGTARLWQAASGKRVAVLGQTTGRRRELRFFGATFSPDGRLVVTAGRGDTGRVWRVASDEPVSVLRGHGGSVYSAAFSPDGRLVLTAGSDGTARLWEAASGKGVSVLGGSGISVGSAAFSPNGRLVLTAGRRGTARVWEAGTGRSVAVLRGHRGEVYSAAFSPDGSSSSRQAGTARRVSGRPRAASASPSCAGTAAPSTARPSARTGGSS